MEQEELEKVMTENLRLAKQNNKMLKKIHHTMVVNRVLRIIYWVIIIGSAFGLYFFLQPYVEGLQGYFEGAKTFFEDPRGYINNLGNQN